MCALFNLAYDSRSNEVLVKKVKAKTFDALSRATIIAAFLSLIDRDQRPAAIKVIEEPPLCLGLECHHRSEFPRKIHQILQRARIGCCIEAHCLSDRPAHKHVFDW